MTIAAGFRFAEGLLLCADSEESTGHLVKVSVPKIEAIKKTDRQQFILTGAGDSHLLTLAFEQLEAALRDSAISSTVVRNTVEKIVRGIHRKYVEPLPLPEEEKPFFDVLVAFRTRHGMDLIHANRVAAIRPKYFALTGYGQIHAAQMMDRWYRPNMSRSEAVMLAVHMLQQTKRYSPYCGGDSRICILDSVYDIESVELSDIQEAERYADRFDLAIRDPFFRGVDMNTTDAEFDSEIEHFRSHLKALREIYRSRVPSIMRPAI